MKKNFKKSFVVGISAALALGTLATLGVKVNASNGRNFNDVKNGVVTKGAYNYLDHYESFKINNTYKHIVSGVELGNEVEEILNGGYVIELKPTVYFESRGGNITYTDRDNDLKRAVIDENCNAANLNLLYNEELCGYRKDDIELKYNEKRYNYGYFIVYSDMNTVNAIDMYTGDKKVVCTMDNNIRQMYVVDNSYLKILCNNSVYRYDLKTKNIEETKSYNDVKGFIPTGFDTTWDKDRNIIIQNDNSLFADESWKSAFEELFAYNHLDCSFEVKKISALDEYVYLNVFVEYKWPKSNKENLKFRIEVKDLFKFGFVSVFDYKYFKKYDGGQWVTIN